MATRILGFTLTWLILGIGFFPAVWVIAWIFIQRSIALEEAEASEAFCEDVARKAAEGPANHSLTH